MNRWKSDVIGSLLRPAYLQTARDAFERGDMDPAAFKHIEDRAVDEAVAMQEAAGLDVVTDGEMRRYAAQTRVGGQDSWTDLARAVITLAVSPGGK